MKRNEYIMHEDDDNSWLQVPLEDCLNLGLIDEISSHSYINNTFTTIFLENGSDAPSFISAAERAGWDLNIRPVYQKYSHVHAMKRYDRGEVLSHVNRAEQVV